MKARLGVAAALALLLTTIPATGQSSSITSAVPTVFFRRLPGGVVAQQADVTFAQAPASEATVTVTLNDHALETRVPAGVSSTRVNVPDTNVPGTATFSLDGGSGLSVAWQPQRKWTVWVMPTSHVDLYSTANAAYTPKQHADAVETTLDLLDQHPDYRFQIENMLPVEEFLRLRPAETERLAAAFASKRLGVGAQYTGMHQSETSDESIVQGQFANEGALEALAAVGTRPNAGIVFDSPNITPQAPQLLRNSGVPYLLFEPNHSYRLYERMHLPWLFRWRAPDGSSVLAWRSAWNYTYEKNQYYNLQGSAPADADARMNTMLRDREQSVYRNPFGEAFPPDPNLTFPFHDLLVTWDYGDNTSSTPEPIDVVRSWNERWAYPQFRMSTASEFMDHMSSTYDQSLVPERSGEVLDAWTFVVMNQALINEFTRRAERDLPAAATWCALAHRLGGRSCDGDAQRRAWQRIGWTEAHDWFYGAIPLADATGLPLPNPHLPLPFTAGEGAVPDFMAPDLDKAAWASEAESIGRGAAADAVESFARLVVSDGDAVVVLNNAARTRSDLVAVPATTKHVIDDATGEEVPAQMIPGAAWASGLGARPVMAAHVDEDLSAQQIGDVTVFVAPDVPGLGYKRFRLDDQPGLPGAGVRPPKYRLRFDAVTGALASIRAGDRELVDSLAPWRFGELLVGKPATDWGDIFDEPQPFKDALQQLSAQSMKAFVGGFPGATLPEECGPVLCETRVAGAFADEHRTTTVVTYRELDRVDLVISTAFTKLKQERFVISMPLAGSPNEIRYSVPMGVHRVGVDEAETQPSVHRQLTDWIEVGDGHGNATAVVSPDVGAFTLGRPDVNLMTDQFVVPEHPWYYPVLMDTSAGGPVSVGTYVARFSIAAGAPGVGATLAESEREPLRGVVVGSQVGGPLQEPASSLLSVRGGRVTAVTPSASGIVVRVLAEGGPLTVTPDPMLGLGVPRRATLQGEPFGGPVGAIDARTWEIVTIVFPEEERP